MIEYLIQLKASLIFNLSHQDNINSNHQYRINIIQKTPQKITINENSINIISHNQLIFHSIQ